MSNPVPSRLQHQTITHLQTLTPDRVGAEGWMLLWAIADYLHQPLGDPTNLATEAPEMPTQSNPNISHWELRWSIWHLVNRHCQQQPDNSQPGNCADFDSLYAAYSRSNPPLLLDRHAFRDILIELSSPLVGWLGRDNTPPQFQETFWVRRSPPPLPIGKSQPTRYAKASTR